MRRLFSFFSLSTLQSQCHRAHPPSRHPSLVFPPPPVLSPCRSSCSCDRFCICRPSSLRSGDASQRKGRRRGWLAEPSRAERQRQRQRQSDRSLSQLARTQRNQTNLNTNNEANCTTTSAAHEQQQTARAAAAAAVRSAPLLSPFRDPPLATLCDPFSYFLPSIYVHRTPANAHCHPTKRTRTRKQGTRRRRGKSDDRATIGQIFDCSRSMGKQRWSGAERSGGEA